MKNTLLTLLLIATFIDAHAQSNLFEYNDNMESRWSSPENRNGKKGAGGLENNGAKGHAYDSIPAGTSYALLDIQGMGIINRIWITINDRSPEMLRSLKVEMYWDGQSKPAVSAPFGDFFGVGLGRTIAFENALFANPEGRSFNSFIQMPFRKGAKIVIVNENTKTLGNIFFDVDYSILKTWNDNYLYFHTYWHRDMETKLAEDFELLPKVVGKGRFLGVNIGVNGNPYYPGTWFGEGEVKMYIDGDTDYPTLNGTGTEDYIGTAWGQGKFVNKYTGCTIQDDSLLQWAFYRYHIPDPVYFKRDIKVALQQIGGADTKKVAQLQSEKVPLIPVTTNGKSYYKKGHVEDLNAQGSEKGWTNFYRSDDVSSTAYFYLDTPTSILPTIQDVAIRTKEVNRQLPK